MVFDFLETETTKASGIKVLAKKFQTITEIPLGIRLVHSLNHILTHQKLLIRFFITDLNALPEKKLLANGSFVTLQQAFRLPKPVFLENVLRKLKEK